MNEGLMLYESLVPNEQPVMVLLLLSLLYALADPL